MDRGIYWRLVQSLYVMARKTLYSIVRKQYKTECDKSVNTQLEMEKGVQLAKESKRLTLRKGWSRERQGRGCCCHRPHSSLTLKTSYVITIKSKSEQEVS